ncbi:MAG: hypothetical protein E7547_09320 [Ruminococcaceae bacterium]|nr:hypothetical protein [Oscillospiraceae bacterium]
MKIKKLLSIVLALTLCFCSLTAVAYAEENTEDEALMPTLPPTEEVDISVVYRPLKSLVSYSDYGPFLDGIVLKITYSDGTSETVAITIKGGEPLEYDAGKFNVYTNLFNTAEVRSPGINTKKIVIDTYENGVEYSGECEIEYLYIPSFVELIFMLYYMMKSVFNPIIDFHI